MTAHAAGPGRPPDAHPPARALLAHLRQRGYRLTPQRQLIVELLEAAAGHIAAEDIHRQVSRRFPGVNRSTVYRTLDLLEELGLLAHTHLGHGEARFHWAEQATHLHLVCHACGATQQVDDLAPLADLALTLRQRYGFRADLAHHPIAGRCAHCADA